MLATVLCGLQPQTLVELFLKPQKNPEVQWVNSTYDQKKKLPGLVGVLANISNLKNPVFIRCWSVTGGFCELAAEGAAQNMLLMCIAQRLHVKLKAQNMHTYLKMSAGV